MLIAARPRSWIVVSRPGATTRNAGFMPRLPRSRRPASIVERPSAACAEQVLVFAQRHRREARPCRRARAAAADAARALPQRHRRAPDEMPAARRLHREDAGHRRGDRERAGRNLQARRFAPRQRQLRRQVAQIGQARQEAEHVDVIGDGAVPLDHLRRRETGARRDIVEIGRKRLRRSRPAAARRGPAPRVVAQALHQLADARGRAPRTDSSSGS